MPIHATKANIDAPRELKLLSSMPWGPTDVSQPDSVLVWWTECQWERNGTKGLVLETSDVVAIVELIKNSNATETVRRSFYSLIF